MEGKDSLGLCGRTGRIILSSFDPLSLQSQTVVSKAKKNVAWTRTR